jgi:predicted lipid-binding transport protein (Tim44 family)
MPTNIQRYREGESNMKGANGGLLKNTLAGLFWPMLFTRFFNSLSLSSIHLALILSFFVNPLFSSCFFFLFSSQPTFFPSTLWWPSPA